MRKALDPRVQRRILSACDPGIRRAVEVLMDSGFTTIESCEGGKGHVFPKPTIKFYGTSVDGFRAYAAVAELDFPVSELRRVYDVIDGELSGPFWELVFYRKMP